MGGGQNESIILKVIVFIAYLAPPPSTDPLFMYCLHTPIIIPSEGGGGQLPKNSLLVS